MKLFIIFIALLAFSLAETNEKIDEETIEDLEAAAASVDLKRTRKEALEPAASTYNSYVPPSQRPPKEWGQNFPNIPANNYYQNYIPNNPIPNYSNNFPPVNNYFPSYNNNAPPQNNFIPHQNDYVPPQNNKPQNNYIPPQNDYVPPQNNYVPPQNNPAPPQNNPAPPHNQPAPTQNPLVQPQNDYYPTQATWVSSTPAAAVITNEQTLGDNGSYKYEYKLSDGTWVGEEGYTLYPNTEYENLVKKGWYSYRGGDGNLYTVTWWADNSGYHAFGDHLPQPPPVPPAIQAALDQAARDEEVKAEAEKNKPIYTTTKPIQPTYTHPTYPQPTNPQPTYPQPTYPQPTYPQPTYPQQNYQQQNPSYGK